jgi:hypothetical protein
VQGRVRMLFYLQFRHRIRNVEVAVLLVMDSFLYNGVRAGPMKECDDTHRAVPHTPPQVSVDAAPTHRVDEQCVRSPLALG